MASAHHAPQSSVLCCALSPENHTHFHRSIRLGGIAMACSHQRTRSADRVVVGVLFTLCAAFLLCAQPALAQSVSGSISGNVVDASKQIVPGALVTLTDEQTGATRNTTSGDGGRFVFSAVQPG